MYLEVTFILRVEVKSRRKVGSYGELQNFFAPVAPGTQNGGTHPRATGRATSTHHRASARGSETTQVTNAELCLSVRNRAASHRHHGTTHIMSSFRRFLYRVPATTRFSFGLSVIQWYSWSEVRCPSRLSFWRVGGVAGWRRTEPLSF